MSDTQDVQGHTPARKRAVRIGRLTNVREVAIELGRLYRQARRGEIPSGDASRMASILQVMRQCMETGAIEDKLDALEAALQRPDNVLPFRRVMN